METIRFDTEQNTTIRIHAIGGDLRVTGRPEEGFEARAPERGRMVARQEGSTIELDSRSNCLVFVPEGVSLEIDSVGGDARVTGARGRISFNMVGGDLTLRRVQQVSVDRVGGDVNARRTAELELGWIGGDVRVDRAQGVVRIQGAGGDLRLSRCDASVQAAAGGDVRLETQWPAGSESSVNAGGDLVCRLASQTNVKVSMQSGGDLVVRGDDNLAYEDGEGELMLGSGEANLMLQAGGDLFIKVGEKFDDIPENEEYHDDFDLEGLGLGLESLLGLGEELSNLQSERIETAVRKALSRTRRRTERERRKRKPGVNIRFNVQDGGSGAASEDEKLSILRMVEAGTITIEEADLLLKALGGGE